METALANATHVIQSALTPVFFLTAVASLLGVFSNRLTQVGDRIHALRDAGDKYRREVARLQRRARILGLAVILAALAGGLTCCSAIALFVDGIRGAERATLLLVIFGSALVSAAGALVCYVGEIVIAGRMLRRED